MTTAVGVVRKAANQTVRVSVPVRAADGRYHAMAHAILELPAGDPIPVFSRNGPVTVELVTVEVNAEPEPEPEAPMKLVLNSHTVCRDENGKVKWESETEPQELQMGTYNFIGHGIPPFRLDTDKIKTGREHF